MIMTSRAATTGTTKFRFERIMRIVSSALNSGKSREGAIVPATTITTTTKGCFFSGREKDSRTNRERDRDTQSDRERDRKISYGL